MPDRIVLMKGGKQNHYHLNFIELNQFIPQPTRLPHRICDKYTGFQSSDMCLIKGVIFRTDSYSTHCHSGGTEKPCIYVPYLVEGKNLTVPIEQQQYKACLKFFLLTVIYILHVVIVMTLCKIHVKIALQYLEQFMFEQYS